MARLSLLTELAADPDAVWALVGDFGGLAAWHPWVPNCTLSADGLVRTIDLGTTSAVEVLDPAATTGRSHSYTVERSPMPVKDYRATWRVDGERGRSVLSIEATFEPSGAPEAVVVRMLEGFFRTGFQVLAARFGVP